jgi:hypothetical protein
MRRIVTKRKTLVKIYFFDECLFFVRRSTRNERCRELLGFGNLRAAQILLDGFRFGTRIVLALRRRQQQPFESFDGVLRNPDA